MSATLHRFFTRSAFAVIALTCLVIASHESRAAVCTEATCDSTQLGSGASIRLASNDAPIALSKFTKKNAAAKKPAGKKTSTLRAKPRKGIIARGAPASAKSKAASIDQDTPHIPTSDQLPPDVANANAGLSDGAAAMRPAANDAAITSSVEIATADQLNEIDRALTDGEPQAETPAMTVAEPAPAKAAPAGPVLRIQPSGQTVGASFMANQSTWDQTSLIGKLFIAIGGLLTIGSVARLFIA